MVGFFVIKVWVPFLRPVGSKRPLVERDKLSPSAVLRDRVGRLWGWAVGNPSTVLRLVRQAQPFGKLRDRVGMCFGKLSNRVGTVLRQAQQPLKCRGKEKKLNKYLVVCGFWCTFAAKLRIECRKGFICAWLI